MHLLCVIIGSIYIFIIRFFRYKVKHFLCIFHGCGIYRKMQKQGTYRTLPKNLFCADMPLLLGSIVFNDSL